MKIRLIITFLLLLFVFSGNRHLSAEGEELCTKLKRVQGIWEDKGKLVVGICRNLDTGKYENFITFKILPAGKSKYSEISPDGKYFLNGMDIIQNQTYFNISMSLYNDPRDPGPPFRKRPFRFDFKGQNEIYVVSTPEIYILKRRPGS